MVEKLVQQVKRQEGLRLNPYTCPAGKLTIGYGRNLEDNGITEQEAERMLLHDLSAVSEELERSGVVPTSLDGIRFSVLLNMAFNMGVPRLLKFKKMWAAVAEQDYDKAALEMLDSRWAKQVGKRATELAEQMRTGEWGV